VLPAFVEPHVHPNRAYSRTTTAPRSLTDAVALSRRTRAEATEDDIRRRVERLLRNALRHGSVRVRAHVDVDEIGGWKSLDATLAAREAFRTSLELELVAFGSAALDPASADGALRLSEALDRGAQMLGAAIGLYSDSSRSLEALLGLARAREVAVDVHIDETLDPAAFLLEELADLTIANGMVGRVTASHGCALAAVEPDAARRTIEKLVAARITVVCLPALNLYLQDRGAATPRTRGLTLVRELLAAGVPVRFGSDNVADEFYPYGDADPLEAAFLAASAAHLDDQDALLAGICGGRTRIEPGDPADLVIVEAGSAAEAIATRPPGRTVVRAGRVVSPAG
jgi:cytosine deaminase